MGANLVSLVMLGAHESRVYYLKMKWFLLYTMSSCRMLMPTHVHVMSQPSIMNEGAIVYRSRVNTFQLNSTILQYFECFDAVLILTFDLIFNAFRVGRCIIIFQTDDFA